jgi:hypothetical protein
MPNLRKRVAALEKAFPSEMSFPSRRDPHIDDKIMRLADERLSEEDREICARMPPPEELGRQATRRESKAINAYLAAITIECQRAGYRSLDDFQASYCPGGGDSRWQTRGRQ